MTQRVVITDVAAVEDMKVMEWCADQEVKIIFSFQYVMSFVKCNPYTLLFVFLIVITFYVW